MSGKIKTSVMLKYLQENKHEYITYEQMKNIINQIEACQEEHCLSSWHKAETKGSGNRKGGYYYNSDGEYFNSFLGKYDDSSAIKFLQKLSEGDYNL